MSCKLSALLFDLTADVLKTSVTEELPNDLEGIETSTGRLYALIDDIYKYVDDVVLILTALGLLLFSSVVAISSLIVNIRVIS
ncbi:hypothetical protein BHM03_00001220, partial [Ensete ventricosum]